MDYKMLVNRDNLLDEYYVPLNLVKTNTLYKDNVYLEEETFKNFELLKQKAKEYGYYIDIMSGCPAPEIPRRYGIRPTEWTA